ncbi:MAG: hypothetical protein U0414_36865 [Polyangiaceae bacterium]
MRVLSLLSGAVVLGSLGCGNIELVYQPPSGSGSTDASSGTGGGSTFSTGSGSSSTGLCPGEVTCESLGATCGPIGNGCGGVTECGTCTVPGETCGGGGVPSVCGKGNCTPKTCVELGKNCGPVANECGETIPCGDCTLPEICGGGPEPSVCALPCKGLCLQQVQCTPSTVTTKITGKVYAPGRNGQPGDPLLNALVYVPNAPVKPFTPGVACEKCADSVSGSPLVSAVTGVDGSFEITNMPVGQNIPLVIQLGRWRRQVVIPSVSACVETPLPADLTRLPRNKMEGDIPHMAIATGRVDGLECVLRKIGIDDSEFTQPTGTGRIHMYTGLGGAGADHGPGTPPESALWGTQAKLDEYDMVLLPCQGDEYYTERGTAADWQGMWQRMHDYAGLGGRVFATHYSYVWMHGKAGPAIPNGPPPMPGPWEAVANWNVGQAYPVDQDGVIDQSFPKGAAFAQWLVNVMASATLGLMPVKVVRNDMDGPHTSAQSQQWMSASDPAGDPLHITFNTPVEAAPLDQCGRVVFSDFHVNANSTGQSTFPQQCDDGPLTPQEKLVEFMLFDLASCVTPDIPKCDPIDCAAQGLQCGKAGDGCGLEIFCGDCTVPGETCGGGNMPGVCGTNVCTPSTCESLGKNCGPVADGCGDLLDCGSCNNPQTCGGGGVANVCGGGGPS